MRFRHFPSGRELVLVTIIEESLAMPRPIFLSDGARVSQCAVHEPVVLLHSGDFLSLLLAQGYVHGHAYLHELLTGNHLGVYHRSVRTYFFHEAVLLGNLAGVASPNFMLFI